MRSSLTVPPVLTSSSSAFESASAQAGPLSLQQACASRYNHIPVHANVSNGKLLIPAWWLDRECRKLDSEPIRTRMEKREQIEYTIMALQTGDIRDNKYLRDHGVGCFKFNAPIQGVDHVLYRHDEHQQICSIAVMGSAEHDDEAQARVAMGGKEEINKLFASWGSSSPVPKRQRLVGPNEETGSSSGVVRSPTSTAAALASWPQNRHPHSPSSSSQPSNVAAASSSSAIAPQAMSRTRYDTMEADPSVYLALTKLKTDGKEITAANLYQELVTSLPGPAPKNIAPLVSSLKVKTGFGSFLENRPEEYPNGIKDILENFTVFAKAQQAYFATKPHRACRSAFCKLRALCFPNLSGKALFCSTDVGKELWDGMKKERQSEYITILGNFEAYLACEGVDMESLLGEPQDTLQFIDKKQTFIKDYSPNDNSKSTLGDLRRTKCRLSLDSKVDNITSKDHKQLARNIVEYAYFNRISDEDFINSLKGAVEKPEADTSIKLVTELMEWTGVEHIHMRNAIVHLLGSNP